LRRRNIDVRSAKSGPDYIDPRFHKAASGAECLNLDAWAMSPSRIRNLAQGTGTLLIEGAMGLFDGAPPKGKGATADLARILNVPVVLVIDASHMAHSVAAILTGFANYDAHVKVAGVIFNKVGSPRHEAILRASVQHLDIAVLGVVHRLGDLHHPSRHLGLVQAQERDDLQAFLDRAADIVEAAVDVEAVLALAQPANQPTLAANTIPPMAQRIAIASDAAFAFAYPHILNDWRHAGADISMFSPLDDQAPDPQADLVILPGGYPELHAGRLAMATQFQAGIRAARMVYGECGGYMTLGEGLIDAQGHRHQMLGLLPLETSFARRKLHLGYRNLSSDHGPVAGNWAGHEFHYATTLKADGPALFDASDAEGNTLPAMGLRNGTTYGSFAHIIDKVVQN
jgi:cobyrinic acid a,c-diamide synthase